jgi:hypothetical protein
MADERKYFVLCRDNCKFESLTKEQIFAAIAEATGNTPTGVDDAFITKLVEQNKNAAMRFWVGTQTEYNAIEARGEIASGTIYCINDGGDAMVFKDPTSIVPEIYPVGAIYMSVVGTSPASFFGGTWERLKDRFLLGAGDTYSAGKTGGAATHALTVSELPRHNHAQQINVPGESGLYKMVQGTSGTVWGKTLSEGTVKGLTASKVDTDYTGSGTAHNNMPPYLTVYMWKRVA